MNGWITSILTAVIILCIWILGVMYYLSEMEKKDKALKKLCTERVTGRIDRMASLITYDGFKPRRRSLIGYQYKESYTYQRNMIYRYTYKGKEYWGMDGRLMPSIFSTGMSGTPVELYCNPSRPSQFYCPAEDRNVRIVRIGMIIIVTVVVGAMVVTVYI